MTGISIRPAVSGDQRTIRQMVRDAHLDPTALHWSHFVMAEHAGEIVGIGQVRPFRRGPELGSLVVRQDRRGQGIGGMIIEALVAHTEGDIYLECRASLAPYYARFGFVEIPWKQAPMPLRLKAGMGALMGRLFGLKLAVMVRRHQAE